MNKKIRKISATIAALGITAGVAATLPIVDDSVYLIQAPNGKGVRYEMTDKTGNRKEAKEIGRRCYNEFTALGKETIIEFIPCDEYWKIARTPNYPAPYKDGYIWHGKDTIKFNTPSGDLGDDHYYVEQKKSRALLEPKKAQAAIAFDTTTNGGQISISCTDSWSHTTTGTNTIMVLTSFGEDTTTADELLDSATYNGDPLTSLDTHTGNGASIESWYLKNPDTGGSFTVSLTYCASGSLTTGGAGVMTYTGVDQTTGYDAHTSGDFTNDNTPAISLDTVADNSWVIAMVYSVNVGPLNLVDFVPASTVRYEVNFNGGQSSTQDTNAAQTPAGTVAMSWTCTGGSCGSNAGDGVLTILSIKPTAGGGGGATSTNPQIPIQFGPF